MYAPDEGEGDERLRLRDLQLRGGDDKLRRNVPTQGSKAFADSKLLFTLLPTVLMAMMQSRATSITSIPYSINAAPSSLRNNLRTASNMLRPVGVI
jgi:hypothetical protein